MDQHGTPPAQPAPAEAPITNPDRLPRRSTFVIGHDDQQRPYNTLAAHDATGAPLLTLTIEYDDAGDRLYQEYCADSLTTITSRRQAVAQLAWLAQFGATHTLVASSTKSATFDPNVPDTAMVWGPGHWPAIGLRG